jgi:xanthine/CO dehydrogenase XdhC/CoxF family maturation factor
MAKTVIVCGKLFDGLSETIRGPMEILIEDADIAEVSGSVGRPSGTKVVDLSDRTVSPGFIDTHVHLCVDGLNLARQTCRGLAAHSRARSALPTIGLSGGGTPELFADRLAAFRQGLAAARYEEGRNARIEFRWAEGRNDRFPALAADFVRRQVAVIAAPGSTPAALAARRRPQPSLLSSRSVVIPSPSAWLPVSIGPAVT